jgi:transcriptional regulator with XRE-family HTH domain
MRTFHQWRMDKLVGVNELAARSGVSKTTIINIEHGRATPRIETIRRLSLALDVEPRQVTEFAKVLENGGD